MRSLPVYHRGRIYLKYIHIVTTGLWLGSGGSILFLLYLSLQSSNDRELMAFNSAMTAIDNYLLIPCACIGIASGAIICAVEELDMFSCSWVITKSVCSIMALFLGTLIIPGMDQLTRIVNLDRFYTRYDLDFNDILITNIILGIFQTLIILFVIFISVKRPCTSFKNCKQCRESRQNEHNSSGNNVADVDRA
jgi:large-conductance mechanosensitive channel